ncbi:Putative G-protein coupled receptor F59B2.13 [Caenorhabditis elegans]|uniref:Putative G-protein coupled receptor F59B2.13 n=1 Tax=Caenorhabditis elegans TaxID=6239 RepID=YMJC_CAEEL|nr:Putative G-protein coupled receptor F59B2.13 [Caenorhabditis elegans]P34488.4 RecName: Full=Putative G-protein coupled receptor F59B2.13 [Caenorhabditis elegans]CAA77580.3 Putative G-protein coupled receptor F59B2.13 [Caenorhabditis elegans]|eukprot:NP_498999.3 Putative G-protein coupled receptor F59B2.13 [Caenorhabditis elegans]
MSNNTTIPSKTATDICLTDRQMSLSVSSTEGVLIGTIIPILVLFGISGNILNLTVLLAPNLRTRSNQLLACLAVADIVSLVVILPHSMAHYETFETALWFRKFYGKYKFQIIAMTNWSIATATWLVFVICLERLIIIKYPLSVRKQAKFFTPRNVVTIIVVTTFILTSYNHVSHACAEKLFCNGTQYHVACLGIDSERWFRNEPNPNSEFMKSVVRVAPQVNAIFVVLIPVVLVIIFNVMLILTLRQRTKLFEPSKTIRGDSQFTQLQSKTEHKVTITVTAIVTCFTITQSPSAFVTFLSSYVHRDWVTLSAICTILVVLGKALNFVLFCLSSASFRQRLLMQTKQGILRKSTRTVSMVTSSTVVVDSLPESRKKSRVAMEMIERRTSASSCLVGGNRADRTHRANSSQSMIGERMPLKEFRRGTSFV